MYYCVWSQTCWRTSRKIRRYILSRKQMGGHIAVDITIRNVYYRKHAIVQRNRFIALHRRRCVKNSFVPHTRFCRE